MLQFLGRFIPWHYPTCPTCILIIWTFFLQLWGWKKKNVTWKRTIPSYTTDILRYCHWSHSFKCRFEGSDNSCKSRQSEKIDKWQSTGQSSGAHKNPDNLIDYSQFRTKFYHSVRHLSINLIKSNKCDFTGNFGYWIGIWKGFSENFEWISIWQHPLWHLICRPWSLVGKEFGNFKVHFGKFCWFLKFGILLYFGISVNFLKFFALKNNYGHAEVPFCMASLL